MNRDSPICPACTKTFKIAPDVHYTAKEAAGYFCPPWRDKSRHERLCSAIETLWPSHTSEIYTCPDCGFGFAWPHIGGDEVFYHILHEQVGYPAWRWDYDMALELPCFREKRGSALDIGAGEGAFLSRLPQGWSGHAIEYSSVTRGLLENRGFTVYADTTEAVEKGPFEVICLFQVLEHLAPFDPMLADVTRMLCPGGWLFITVPDGLAMREQERRLGCPDMPPNHVNRWTPKSLAKVLTRHGFEVNNVKEEPDSWKLIASRLYLAVLSSAMHPNTLAAKAYQIRDKRRRIPFLAALGALELLRHLKDIRWMRRGGAFSLAARKPL